MNHRLKTTIFKVLDVLPHSVGDHIYHNLQRFLQKNSLEEKIKANSVSFNTIKNILEKNAITLTGQKVLEIGSGWVPIMPYLLKYELGAAHVHTYDLNEHYNKQEITELNAHYNKKGHNLGELDDRGLPAFITYGPKTNVIAPEVLDGNDSQFVFSRFVLEHVPPDKIKAMHERFIQHLKRPFYVMHLISPSDHRAYGNSGLSYYDFLKYSEEEWNRIQTRFDYHNRLRLPQYLKIFEGLGYEVVSLRYDGAAAGTEKYRKFKALNIHEDFKRYTEEELLAGSIDILLKYS